MGSDFTCGDTSAQADRWKPIDCGGSRRYRFFRTRIYGKLHFVKTIDSAYFHDLLTTEALRKEFEIGYDLDHPNIVRYLKYENNTIFQEFIDGVTLRQMLSDNDPRLTNEKFIAKICRQLLDAIAYIHSKGILHLDLKPENIMITRIGSNAKIIDFGCAYSAPDNTTTGFTLQYKAPEQNSGATNAYTDLYLLGRVIDELTRNTSIASGWKRFIAKTTAQNPADRFNSEADAIKAIPSAAHKKTIIIAIGSLIAIIAIAAAITLRPQTPEPQDDSQPQPQETQTIPDPQPQETKPIADPQSPAEKFHRRAAAEPANETVNDNEIRRAVKDTIERYYTEKVIPLAPFGMNYSEMDPELARRVNEAEGWGKPLKFELIQPIIDRYPAREDFIKEIARQEFEANCFRALRWRRGQAETPD